MPHTYAADAAVWVTAAEDASPWEPGRFVSAYSRNRQASHVGSIEASPIGPAIVRPAADHSAWHARPSSDCACSAWRLRVSYHP